MERHWPLADLAGLTELAYALGVRRPVVANWTTRYADFPKPLVVLAAGSIYSRKAVVAWHAKQWPAGEPKLGRKYPKPE